MRFVYVLLLLLVNTPLLADYPLEIIELKGRPMEEVMPIIRPFVSSDGAVTGMQNQLILRTSPESLRDIRAILSRIDTPPRRLLISVRHGQLDNGEAGGVAVDIGAMIGKRTKVIVGHPGGDGSIRLQGLDADTRNQSDLISRIQTTEGKPAFIATGESIPITTYRSYGDGEYRHFQSHTQYRDVASGFYALPRLNGQQVTLELSQQVNRPGNKPDSFEVMQASTSVSGQLGEWISLGGTTLSESSSRRGIHFDTGSRENREHNIWLKVDEIR
ncbi:MAG: hypothetical protein KDI74_09695 [Gammaproteobacteria bacterium]|nr:hypothetical protein [Gammaproteobacteria bacterium]